MEKPIDEIAVEMCQEMADNLRRNAQRKALDDLAKAEMEEGIYDRIPDDFKG